MNLPSVMKHSFSQVPRAEIQRSSFDRSHGHKTTFDAGYLIPVFIDEALPGDTFNLRMSIFARLATPIKPIMDNMYLDSFFFAVPIRLIWDNWVRFNGEQKNPTDSTDYLIPQMVSTAVIGYATHSIHDYFGLPVKVPGYSHSVLWHRAHNLIWNEWFRDQNLQDAVAVDTDDGPDLPTQYQLLRRGKRHDYFTSALPWPQKGDAVALPLGVSAPVSLQGSGQFKFSESTGGNITGIIRSGGAISTNLLAENIGSAAGTKLYYSSGIVGIADLEAATGATINALRQAFQIQRMYERDARGGTRYTEIVRSHFGVVSPDARLQRPEYLGGGSTPVNVHPVQQTSVSAATPQGNLAAFGTVSMMGNGFTKSFTEHCVILGFVSVRADLTYQQCINRMFSRSTRFDFYWPALSHIGEQAIFNKEIYQTNPPVPAVDNAAFGYQERFAEYRYKPSLITGLFRSDATGTLDLWHLSQDFNSLPLLNASFIEDNPPIDRVIAVPSEPHFLADIYFKLNCARPMPVFGVPGLIDHF